MTPSQLPHELVVRFKKAPHVMERASYLAAQRGRTLLVGKSPVDRGQFKNAWTVRRTKTGVDVINDAPYAGIIELGARPHPVSQEGIEALVGWVWRHRASFGLGGGKDAQAEVRRIAHAIAWKIRKYPTKPHYVVRSSMDDLRRFLAEEIERAMADFAKKKATEGG